jgi:hypothetical protein
MDWPVAYFAGAGNQRLGSAPKKIAYYINENRKSGVLACTIL